MSGQVKDSCARVNPDVIPATFPTASTTEASVTRNPNDIALEDSLATENVALLKEDIRRRAAENRAVIAALQQADARAGKAEAILIELRSSVELVAHEIKDAANRQRRYLGVPCQTDSKWHASTYEQWAERLRAALIPTDSHTAAFRGPNVSAVPITCGNCADLLAALKRIVAADDVKSLAGIVAAMPDARAAIATAECR